MKSHHTSHRSVSIPNPHRNRSRRRVGVILLLAALFTLDTRAHTYTPNADFGESTRANVNTNTADELQLNGVPTLYLNPFHPGSQAARPVVLPGGNH